MAMIRQLWSLNALSVELGRDRRTVAKILNDTAPDGVLKGKPAWYLQTALQAFGQYDGLPHYLVNAEDAAHNQCGFLSDRVEDWEEIYGEEPIEWTFEEAVENLPYSAEQILTWLRAGAGYVKAGDWATGEGFILRPHWLIDFSWFAYVCTKLTGDRKAARLLKLSEH